MCAGIESFEEFALVISVLGPRPDGMTIDRIENEDNYSCGKCPDCVANGWVFNLRWATDETQSNNRRTNKFIPHNGRKLTYSQWAKETGIDKTTIRKRWLKNWSAEKTLSLDGTRKAA